MNLSKQNIEILVDLVENKLSHLDVWDRDDRREQLVLQRCLAELKAGSRSAAAPAGVGAPVGDGAKPRRGRPPKRATHPALSPSSIRS